MLTGLIVARARGAIGASSLRRWAGTGSGVAAALMLWFGTAAEPCVGQTVERRYEPHATGAVTTIYPDEAALGARDVIDLLRWRVPGLVVEWCDPRHVAIRIRGQMTLTGDCANPLVIVDGFPIPGDGVTAELLSLNPFRVERIEVLRDVASTSVYGGRGARGVILVFTRRGGGDP